MHLSAWLVTKFHSTKFIVSFFHLFCILDTFFFYLRKQKVNVGWSLYYSYNIICTLCRRESIHIVSDRTNFGKWNLISVVVGFSSFPVCHLIFIHVFIVLIDYYYLRDYVPYPCCYAPYVFCGALYSYINICIAWTSVYAIKNLLNFYCCILRTQIEKSKCLFTSIVLCVPACFLAIFCGFRTHTHNWTMDRMFRNARNCS